MLECTRHLSPSPFPLSPLPYLNAINCMLDLPPVPFNRIRVLPPMSLNPNPKRAHEKKEITRTHANTTCNPRSARFAVALDRKAHSL
jgi:hypothetical protein